MCEGQHFLTHFAVYFLLACMNNKYYYVTLIVSEDPSTSEHHSAPQVMPPESDRVTVHSTPAGTYVVYSKLENVCTYIIVFYNYHLAEPIKGKNSNMQNQVCNN